MLKKKILAYVLSIHLFWAPFIPALVPSVAEAAGCFWVGGTGTWDTTNTGGGGAGGIKWASASGGSSACAGGGTGGAPSTSDTATFDAASGGGTVTVNYGGLLQLQQITLSAFTGTLDFATNNNNVTLTGGTTLINTGSGTRTFNMGSGTWTFTSGAAYFDQNGATNLTFNGSSATLAFTGNLGTVGRRIYLGNRTYGTITVAGSTAPTEISGAGSTIGTLTISPGNVISFANNATINVTNLTNIVGSNTALTVFLTNNATFGRYTLSSANNFTGSWMALSEGIFSGGGTFSATNSFDLGSVSGITISPPSGGGGGGGGNKVIGGGI